MNPETLAVKRSGLVRAPAASPDYYLRQGILKLLAIKDSDVRILTLEQCRDAVDKSLHAGGAFSATIPLVALYYGGFIDIDVVDPDAARPGSVRAQQGPRGGGAGLDLRRARLLRPRRSCATRGPTTAS